MHHSHTPNAVLVRLSNEGCQGQTRFIAAQTMQIDFALNGPVAFAQFARYLRANAGPSETQGFVGVEQGADIKLIAQGVLDDLRFVFMQLCCYWRARCCGDVGFVVQRQRRNFTDGPCK